MLDSLKEIGIPPKVAATVIIMLALIVAGWKGLMWGKAWADNQKAEVKAEIHAEVTTQIEDVSEKFDTLFKYIEMGLEDEAKSGNAIAKERLRFLEKEDAIEEKSNQTRGIEE